jgi:hypothetical protein
MIALPHQLEITHRMLHQDRLGVWAGAGLGKTFCAISTMTDGLRSGRIKAALVVATPKLVEGTWPAELRKWAPELRVLRLATPKNWNIKKQGEPPCWAAMDRCEADVYLITYQTMGVLSRRMDASKRRCHPNAVFFDEMHNLGGRGAWHADFMRMRNAFPIRYGLTATPYSSSIANYQALYGILDDNKALGNITQFREKYMERHYERRGVWLDPKGDKLRWAIQDIKARTAGLSIYVEAKAHLNLPDMETTVHDLELDPEAAEKYEEFRDAAYAQWEDEHGVPVDIYSPTAETLTGKLQQATAGFLYGDGGAIVPLHSVKVDAVREIQRDGKPAILFTRFIHEAEVFRRDLGAVPYSPEVVPAWNRGEINLMTLHMSAAEGLNLQHGGSRVIWASIPWTHKTLEQGSARVHRMGQTKKTECHILAIRDTVDYHALGAIARRHSTAAALLCP